MKITVNGDAVSIRKGITIADLLVERKVRNPDMVTVELNGTILERRAFPDTVLSPEDKIEFLYFMGGGEGGRCP
jgi:sulfur carrier protein